MKRKVLTLTIFVLLITGKQLYAQTGNVGIGTLTPDISAKLDISATDKGVLLPQIDLQGLNDATTVTNPAKSLLIWNTGATWGDSAYYYNSGTPGSPVWIEISDNSVSNTLDVGYILGWAASTTPPDFLLPLSGGTFNKADFPDLIAQHTSHPNQFIASENATTFTLKDVNTTGRFLRGGAAAGADQAMSTALPNTNFSTDNQGSHAHSVDPPATNSSYNGGHSHTMGFLNDDYNGTGGGNSSLEDDGGSWHYKTTSSAPTHIHIVDIAAFWSASSGDHTHSITGGGDAETRPINTSVIWCIKAKSTSTTGAVTINNNTLSAPASSQFIGSDGTGALVGKSVTGGNDLSSTAVNNTPATANHRFTIAVSGAGFLMVNGCVNMWSDANIQIFFDIKVGATTYGSFGVGSSNSEDVWQSLPYTAVIPVAAAGNIEVDIVPTPGSFTGIERPRLSYIFIPN